MKCVSLARPWFWGLRGTNIDCVESWQTYLFFIFKPANILLLPIPEWWQGRVVMSICGRVIWLVVSNIWLVVSKFAVFFHQKPMVKRGDQIRISAEFISWGLLAEPIHKLTTPLFWICLVIWKAKMISAKYPLSLSLYMYISPSPRLPSSKMEHCCALPSCVFFVLHWTIVIIPSVQNVKTTVQWYCSRHLTIVMPIDGNVCC